MNWIDALNESSAAWGEALWRGIWQGGLAALIAWVICRVWRKMPASVSCAIWLIVCLKMVIGLLPLALALPLLPAEKGFVSNVQPAPTLPLSGATLVVSDLPPVNAMLSAWSYAFLGWFLGVAAIFLFVSVVLLRLRRLVKKSISIDDPSLLSLVNALSKRMGVRKMPKLLVASSQTDTFTLGIFRPVIVLSRSTLEGCSRQEIELILAHELAHLKRHDALLALIPQAVTTLFFFHPAAWLAAKEFELARESACDEIAMRCIQARPDVYGQLLLKLSSPQERSASLVVLGMSSHFRVLSRRIAMLKRFSSESNPRLGRMLTAVGFVGALLIAPWTLVQAHAAVPLPNPPTPQTQPYLPVSNNPGKVSPAPKEPQKKAVAKVADRILVCRLKYTSADSVRQILRKHSASRSIEIVADSRTNTIYIAGPTKTANEVLKQAYVLDLQQKPSTAKGTTAEWTTYSAGDRDALALANKACAAYERKYGAPPSVLIDRKNNILIQEPSNSDKVKKLVAELNAIKLQDLAVAKAPKPNPTQPVPTSSKSTRLLVMLHDASEVAKKLDQEFSRKYNRNQLRILVEGSTNSILIEADQEIATEVLARYGALYPSKAPASNYTRTIRRFPIANKEAERACAELRLKLKKDTTVDFLSYDPTDNSLVIRASAEEMDEIGKQIQAIDQK